SIHPSIHLFPLCFCLSPSLTACPVPEAVSYLYLLAPVSFSYSHLSLLSSFCLLLSLSLALSPSLSLSLSYYLSPSLFSICLSVYLLLPICLHLIVIPSLS